VFGFGVLASVLVHLLLFVLFPDLVRIGVMPGGPPAPPERVAVRTEIQLLNPVASESAPEIPAEEELAGAGPAGAGFRPPPRSRRGRAPPAATPQEAPAAPGTGSARDALRPGFRDPRLYVTPREIVPDQRTEHERYMEHLQARVDALNDSIHAGLPVTDWTVRDRDGKRWGLSPEGLHLGGVTVPRALLPLPAATGDNAQLERAREQQRQRDEIRRQEEDRDRRATHGGARALHARAAGGGAETGRRRALGTPSLERELHLWRGHRTTDHPFRQRTACGSFASPRKRREGRRR
jgi:hypothetical protein